MAKTSTDEPSTYWRELVDIRSSVGRRNGRHSQNGVLDQEIVRTLLNRVPLVNGGSGGSLVGNLTNGICGDALFDAILRFQRMHLSSHADGHVDPSGPTIRLLNQLAAPTADPQIPASAVVRLPDGGTARPADPASLARRAWIDFRNEIRRALQHNPNLPAVSEYLDGIERAAGSEAPAVREYVAFGNAALSAEHVSRRFRAHILDRGSILGTFGEGGAVVLTPRQDGAAGGHVVLGPHTLIQILGRHSFQTRRREGSGDTILQNGQLRAHLGQLSGRR